MEVGGNCLTGALEVVADVLSVLLLPRCPLCKEANDAGIQMQREGELPRSASIREASLTAILEPSKLEQRCSR